MPLLQSGQLNLENFFFITSFFLYFILFYFILFYFILFYVTLFYFILFFYFFPLYSKGIKLFLHVYIFPPPFVLLQHEYLDIVLNAIQQDLLVNLL